MQERSTLKRARLFWCSLCVLVAHTAIAQPRAPFDAAPVASYDLNARLDTDWHRVDATGVITFTNRSAVPLRELWFHLYPNAFSSDRTRFWRTINETRRSRRTLYQRGKLDVLELRIHGDRDTDLWSQADSTTPGDPDDTTDRRVPLREPLQPGETIVLDVRFATQLPFIVERMGWVESFHAVAQWFPKLARLEPDGTWRHYPYEALAEFYADYGNYDVTVDAPRGFTIVAPGQVSVENRDSERTVTRFHMSSVHDFAWFAWDRFKCSRRSAAAIELEICVPPGHERNAALETAEIVDAMPRFQARFGAYPYRDLVVVHPPDVANPAGGMEYPGLIVTGAPWYTSLTGTRMLSAVTLHELAHQWFYGIVATDEVEYPVLDEGLASWAELTALTDEYGSGSAFSGFGITVSASAVAQWSGTNGYKPGPLAASARTFSSFSQLTSSVYARMTLLLQTLGNVYGQQRLRAALQAYARDNRFEHPGPQALVTAFESEMGAAAAANLERALHADAWVDFEPTHIEATSVDEHQWTYTIHVHRAGTLDVPVDVAVMLNNGQVQVMRCEFRQAECMLQARTASPLSSVTVDPHRSVTIESRCGNNTLWFAQPQRPWRLFERLLYGLQVIAGELIL